MRISSLTFLGSGSGGGPNLSRACTATALNMHEGFSWLVDCAEGTQLQMRKTRSPHIVPRNINNVFITHMHVDHCMGLIPFMVHCLGRRSLPSSGSEEDIANLQNSVRLNIYGPQGLRTFVRQNLSLTYTTLSSKYTVHELLRASDTPAGCHPDNLHPNEAIGRNILQEANHERWLDFVEGNASAERIRVDAGSIIHRVPCFGYVFTCLPVPTAVSLPPNNTVPDPALPRPVFSHLSPQLVSRPTEKPLDKPFPDVSLAVRKKIRPSKTVVLGDTSDATNIQELAMGADVVVHEATHTSITDMNAIREAFERRAEVAQFGNALVRALWSGMHHVLGEDDEFFRTTLKVSVDRIRADMGLSKTYGLRPATARHLAGTFTILKRMEIAEEAVGSASCVEQTYSAGSKQNSDAQPKAKYDKEIERSMAILSTIDLVGRADWDADLLQYVRLRLRRLLHLDAKSLQSNDPEAEQDAGTMAKDDSSKTIDDSQELLAFRDQLIQDSGMEAFAKQSGHSTPEMAGAFAKAVGAKSLVLNHIGTRYPDPGRPPQARGTDIKRMEKMQDQYVKRSQVIEEIARQANQAWGRGDANVAFDLMVFHVDSPGQDDGSVVKGREIKESSGRFFEST